MRYKKSDGKALFQKVVVCPWIYSIMEMAHESIDRNNPTVATLHYKCRMKLCNDISQVS